MRKIMILVLCLAFMIFNKGDTLNCCEIKFNKGCGTLFENGRLLTAYHLVDGDDEILYFDAENDIAVVDLSKNGEISEKKTINFYGLGVVKSAKSSLLYIDWLINKGESGKPYIKDNKLIGVFVGRKGDKAIVTTISDEVYAIISEGGGSSVS